MTRTTATQDRLSPHGDDVYTALIAAHEGLDEAESHALNVRLVLLLANEVGDLDRLMALFAQARSAAAHPASGNEDR